MVNGRNWATADPSYVFEYIDEKEQSCASFMSFFVTRLDAFVTRNVVFVSSKGFG